MNCRQVINTLKHWSKAVLTSNPYAFNNSQTMTLDSRLEIQKWIIDGEVESAIGLSMLQLL